MAVVGIVGVAYSAADGLKRGGFVLDDQAPYYPRIAHACGANRMNAFVFTLIKK